MMLENSTLLYSNSSFSHLILRNQGEKEERRVGEFFSYLFVFCLSLLLNGSVFYVVLYGKKTSRRSVGLLIAHLSVVSIAWSLHGVLYAADKYEIIILRAPYLCGILSFARNTHHAVFPLNVCGIVYERLRSFREECDGYYLIVHRAILLMWVIGAAFSWPSYLSYKFEPDTTGVGFGTCKKIIPLGWHVVYEVVRFLFLHLLVCGCLLYALHSVKSKQKHCRLPIQNGSRRRTMHRIRYLCYYSNIFIFDWVPIGFLISLSKLLQRENLSETEHSIAEVIMRRTFQIVAFLHYLYGFINPLVYVRLNENIGISYVLGIDAIRSLRDYCLVSRNSKQSSVEKEDALSKEAEIGEKGKQVQCDCEKVELSCKPQSDEINQGQSVVAQGELELTRDTTQNNAAGMEKAVFMEDEGCCETYV